MRLCNYGTFRLVGVMLETARVGRLSFGFLTGRRSALHRSLVSEPVCERDDNTERSYEVEGRAISRSQSAPRISCSRTQAEITESRFSRWVEWVLGLGMTPLGSFRPRTRMKV